MKTLIIFWVKDCHVSGKHK